MRLLILLAFMLLLDVYIYQAVRFMSHDRIHWVKIAWRASYWVTTLISVSLVVAMLTGYADKWSPSFIVYTRTFLFIIYFSKMFFATFMLIDDIRRGVQYLFNLFKTDKIASNGRSAFIMNTALVIAMLPFTSLLYGIIRNPYRYKVHSSDIKLAKPDNEPDVPPLKIVHISDIHSGSFTFKEPVYDAIEMINRLEPDLVFFTGDLVNNTADEMEPFMDVFQGIKAKIGVFSSLGNHDYGDYVRWPSPDAKRLNLEKLMAVHKDLGWNLLMDENRIIEWHGRRIAIAGIQNCSGSVRFNSYGDLNKALVGTEDVDVRLLLSHDPSYWEAAILKNHLGVDMTFSGHTHGFQFGVEIPGWFKWSPVQYVYKQWAGIYEQEKKYINVNRGLGFLGYPGRVGILPEISEIRLSV